MSVVDERNNKKPMHKIIHYTSQLINLTIETKSIQIL